MRSYVLASARLYFAPVVLLWIVVGLALRRGRRPAIAAARALPQLYAAQAAGGVAAARRAAESVGWEGA
jgi:hypothetical protein